MWHFFVDNWFVISSVLTVVGLVVGSYLTSPIAMAMGVKNILKTYWREIFIAFVIVASLMYVAQLRETIKEQEAQIAIDKINIQTLTTNNTKLEAAIKDTNTVIERFDQFTIDTKKQFDGLNKTVIVRNQQLASQLQSILGEKRPQTCEEAILYLIEARKEYAR